jgi:hypothetical protein
LPFLVGVVGLGHAGCSAMSESPGG